MNDAKINIDEDDPARGLAAVVALRRLADDLERKAVENALNDGWSWAKIALALGVSKQAAHRRLKHIPHNTSKK